MKTNFLNMARKQLFGIFDKPKDELPEQTSMIMGLGFGYRLDAGKSFKSCMAYDWLIKQEMFSLLQNPEDSDRIKSSKYKSQLAKRMRDTKAPESGDISARYAVIAVFKSEYSTREIILAAIERGVSPIKQLEIVNPELCLDGTPTSTYFYNEEKNLQSQEKTVVINPVLPTP